MELNTEFILSFIEQRWELKKKEIASILGYDASVLSRKVPFQYNVGVVYEKIFNVESKSSIAYKKKENESNILGALKVFIIKSGLKENLEDIWDNSYVDFVVEMLGRANMQPPKKKNIIPPENDKNKDFLNVENAIMPSIDMTPFLYKAAQQIIESEKILKIFNEYINEFELEKFICGKPTILNYSDYSDLPDYIKDIPVVSYSMDFEDAVYAVIENVEREILDLFSMPDNAIYCKIQDFIDILHEYISYLKWHMMKSDDNKWIPYDEKIAQENCNRVVSYHQELEKLYSEISC